jgi:superfamily II DNA or RNA helicase
MINLRPYQIDIVNTILNNLKKGASNRQCITLPTGGGKTVIASKLISDLTQQNKRVFFVVAGKELVMQSYNKFISFNIPTSIIKSGYDKLYNQYAKCQILMIQTYARRQDTLPDLKPDVIVIDEVDYGYNGGMLKNLLEKYPNSQIVGLTATPLTEKGFLLPGFDTYYDKITVKDLQQQGFLSIDKNYIPVTLDLSGVKVKSTGDYNEEELELVCNKTYILNDIMDTYKQLDKDYKGICFAISIKHAENLQQAFLNIGVTCGVIHSKMNTKHADYWLNKHKRGDIRMLVNVGMLTRGYDDINIIDILMCRPTLSERLYKQIVGRAARPDANGLGFFRHIDYAGNIQRFGLWSDDNMYVLNTAPKKEREFEPVVCPNCFEVIYEKSKICLNCGHCLIEQQEKRERKIIESQRVKELIEYKSLGLMENLEKLFDNSQNYYINTLRPLKPIDISIEEFNKELLKIVKYCIKMKYKSGWVYYKLKNTYINNCNINPSIGFNFR